MLTYVFPGQGAHKKGMGHTLFEEFKEITEIANKILGYSIKELCLDAPEMRLNQTLYVQPALFTVNALMYYKKIREEKFKPDFVAGHSIGEYNALLAAEAFDFETGLTLIKKRAELMSASSGGRMAAIIGLKIEQILEIINKNGLTSLCISHDNTPTQVVISGPKNDIIHAERIFETAGAQLYIHLELDGAFHSKYMKDAQDEFRHYLENINFSELRIPVIANCTGRPYENDSIKKNLIDQFTESVKWTQTIRYLLQNDGMKFVEVGPGTILTGMIKKISNNMQ